MTKVTLEVTDEQLQKLDYIGVLNVNMAGVLYNKITISSDADTEQNDTCDVIDISGAKTVGDMLQIAFPNSFVGSSETEEGQVVEYYMKIDGEEEIILDPEFWNASYMEKRNAK